MTEDARQGFERFLKKTRRESVFVLRFGELPLRGVCQRAALFCRINSLDGDRVSAVVGAFDKPFPPQVPQSGLKMLAGTAQKVLEGENTNRGSFRILKRLDVEQAQDALPLSFLRFLPNGRLVLIEDPPMQPLGVTVSGVVAGAQLRIAQYPVRLGKANEDFGAAGLAIIGMIALGEHSVHTLNRLGVRIRAELHNFIAIQLQW